MRAKCQGQGPCHNHPADHDNSKVSASTPSLHAPPPQSPQRQHAPRSSSNRPVSIQRSGMPFLSFIEEFLIFKPTAFAIEAGPARSAVLQNRGSWGAFSWSFLPVASRRCLGGDSASHGENVLEGARRRVEKEQRKQFRP